MLKAAQLILVFLSFVGFALAQSSEVRLLDKFERISCSDFRFRIDSFMAEIASNAATIGYVALSSNGNQLDVFRRRKMIDEQLALRKFEKKRVVFVRRNGLAGLETELWVGGAGSKVPFDYDSTWSYELRRGAKPFILVTGGFDDSECPPAKDGEFVGRFLRANPYARVNVVIRCRGQNCFRAMRTGFTKDLVENGVSRGRVKFFHVPITSDYYTYEFWILN